MGRCSIRRGRGGPRLPGVPGIAFAYSSGVAGEGFFERHAGISALESRDFRLLLLGTTLVGLAMPIQFLTQVFWVQQEYPDRDVFYVGLIAGSRGVAMILFSLLGGAIADRFERRRVLLVCETLAFVLNAGVAALMLTNPLGDATIALLVVFTFFAAGNMAIDMPTRQAAIPAVVGMDRVGSAISLNMVAMQVTFPLTLPVAGLLNDIIEPGRVYALSLLAWLAVIPLIAMLQFRDRGKANRAESMLRNIREGLAYTRRDATIFAIISLVLVLQVVGMPGVATLGPVWMTEVLGLSKREFGLIGMTWGLGTAAGSLFFAWRNALPARGATICAAVLTFGVAVAVFGHSRIVPLTAMANFTLGFCMVATTVSAATIVQHVVSDEMRGRVMGLFPLAMGLQMIAAVPVGGLGQLFGLEFIVPALGWITITLAVLIVIGQPGLRAIRPAEPASAVPVASAGAAE